MWGGLGGGIALFSCWQKQVGGLGPFGPALKNRHTFLFKSGTMRKPIKDWKNDVICSDGGGLSTWRRSGERGVIYVGIEYSQAITLYFYAGPTTHHFCPTFYYCYVFMAISSEIRHPKEIISFIFQYVAHC
jgi:hypothetical protein